jgi:DDE superfamily endonuclease
MLTKYSSYCNRTVMVHPPSRWYRTMRRKIRLQLIIGLVLDDDRHLDDDEYLRMIHERDRRIPRSVLLDPQAPPWEKLYVAKNEQAMITFTGLNYAAFHSLETLFQPYFYNLSPHNTTNFIRHRNDPYFIGGRPRKINSKSCLALCLAYYRFRGGHYCLQGWFGLTLTAISTWLRFTFIILIGILRTLPECIIETPTDEKIEYLKGLVRRKYPTLHGVYCSCDRLKIGLERAGNYNMQQMFYNGWQHGHYLSNLFVFTPEGRIIFCVLNAMGTYHDSTLARSTGLYDLLHKIYKRTGGKCVCDSAFVASNNPSVI